MSDDELEKWPECECNSPTPLVHAIWCPIYWHMKKLDEKDEADRAAQQRGNR